MFIRSTVFPYIIISTGHCTSYIFYIRMLLMNIILCWYLIPLFDIIRFAVPTPIPGVLSSHNVFDFRIYVRHSGQKTVYLHTVPTYSYSRRWPPPAAAMYILDFIRTIIIIIDIPVKCVTRDCYGRAADPIFCSRGGDVENLQSETHFAGDKCARTRVYIILCGVHNVVRAERYYAHCLPRRNNNNKKKKQNKNVCIHYVWVK